MLGSKFKFSTIGWTTVPYEITNSFSNSAYPYYDARSLYTQTFFILPPNDSTIHNYTQGGRPFLESGFWNKNGQFINTHSILGDYGNATGCLLYGDISRCLGFNQFALNGQALNKQSELQTFNAYADNEPLYKAYETYTTTINGTTITNETFYGIFAVLNQKTWGIFYPNYAFYYSNINLNNYFNDISTPIININANYGYFIPVYQTSGVCPLVSNLFGSCQTKPSSVLNMINSAKNDSYAYQYIENFLYFANSTSVISFSFPNYIPIYHWYIEASNSAKTWYSEENYTTTGYGWTLNQTNQSTSMLLSSYANKVQITPKIPTSGSQANMFAFYNTHWEFIFL